MLRFMTERRKMQIMGIINSVTWVTVIALILTPVAGVLDFFDVLEAWTWRVALAVFVGGFMTLAIGALVLGVDELDKLKLKLDEARDNPVPEA